MKSGDLLSPVATQTQGLHASATSLTQEVLSAVSMDICKRKVHIQKALKYG